MGNQTVSVSPLDQIRSCNTSSYAGSRNWLATLQAESRIVCQTEAIFLNVPMFAKTSICTGFMPMFLHPYVNLVLFEKIEFIEEGNLKKIVRRITII